MNDLDRAEGLDRTKGEVEEFSGVVDESGQAV
jgi:hypothetical protein